jgi:tetratricopeptide (TPR) repeat protein
MSVVPDPRSRCEASKCECPTSVSALVDRTQADFEIEFFERVLHRAGDYVEVLAALAERLCEKGWYHRAVVIDERLALLRPRDPATQYNRACSLARVGRADEALAALRSAIKNGFDDARFLLADDDLASLRDRPEFQRLVTRLTRDNRQAVLK